MAQNMKCSSYSDLFEDFFRTDAVKEDLIGSNGSGANVSADINNIFEGYLNDSSNDMRILQNGVEPLQSYFMPPEQSQQQSQISFPLPFYQQSIPSASASVQKPGFIRNRARKNMRQKSVAAAVKASHLMAAVNGQAGSGYPLMQMYQPTIPAVITSQIQVPYYQAAAQIPTYHSASSSHQQPQLILAKSPVSQPLAPLMRSAHPSHPNSPARSPNSNSSDYVKFKLQQKIRSRMVSKGQIPPNPTEEELRLCGLQVAASSSSSSSIPQHHHASQLPTPKQSPQIPRAFDNNANAYINAPLIINNQFQGQSQQANEDYMKYLDWIGCSQKDPLLMSDSNTTIQSLKQQYHQGQALQEQQQQQQDYSFSPQEGLQSNNYEQFFSDFILY